MCVLRGAVKRAWVSDWLQAKDLGFGPKDKQSESSAKMVTLQRGAAFKTLGEARSAE